MEFSKHISALKASPTVALNSAAKELSRKGVKVYNFAVGEPDFATPDVVCDVAIESIRNGRTKYGPPGGSPAFKQAIIDKLKRDNGLSYSQEEIVAGIGAKELLFHLMLALLNEGDEVLIPAPYWVSYTDQVIATGATPIVIPMPEDHDAPRLTAEMIDAYATDRTKLIILNSPNNPAGYVLPEDQIKALGAYLETKPWWIISDEIYEYMAFDHTHVSSGAVCPALMDRYIHVNGLSKGAAMTGWRVGFIAAPPALAKLVKNLQSQSSTCLPPFIEDAAIKALELGKGLLEDKFELLKSRRDLAKTLLCEIPGVRMIEPQGAFYCFIDIRAVLAEKHNSISSFDFSRQLLEQFHVAMVPGEAFGVAGFLRLSYATDEKTISEGIERLRQALVG